VALTATLIGSDVMRLKITYWSPMYTDQSLTHVTQVLQSTDDLLLLTTLLDAADRFDIYDTTEGVVAHPKFMMSRVEELRLNSPLHLTLIPGLIYALYRIPDLVDKVNAMRVKYASANLEVEQFKLQRKVTRMLDKYVDEHGEDLMAKMGKPAMRKLVDSAAGGLVAITSVETSDHLPELPPSDTSDE